MSSGRKIGFVLPSFPVISQTFIINQINALFDAGKYITIFSYKNNHTGNIHSSFLKHSLLDRTQFFYEKSNSGFLRLFFLFHWVVKNYNEIHWRMLVKSLNFFKFGKEALTLDLFYKAQWFLKGEKNDIIHVHFGNTGERIAYLRHIGFLDHTRLVCTFHGFDLIPNDHKGYKIKYFHLLQQADAFTVNTLYLKDILYKIAPDPSKIHVLPVGLDTNYFYPTRSKLENNKFSILFCGRLIELKGIPVAIEVLKTLRDRGFENIEFSIIGEGRMRREIELIIDKYRLNSQIKMYGAANQEFVKEKLETANLFLMPGIIDPKTGRAETQGLVIQEAQAMEVPVIVSDVGGMKYGLIDGETGFVVKNGNIENFADKIELLVRNKNLQRKMGKAGREFVVKNYDSELLREKLENIYDEISNKY